MRRPRALLFDYGDTILRIESMDVEAGVERIFALAGNPRRVRSGSMLAAVARLQDDWQHRTAASLIEGSFQALLRNATERLGLIFEHSGDELERIFWDAAMTMSPAPGIEDLLEEAAERTIPCAIVSNSIFTEATLRHELRRHGLEAHFRFVMTSTDYGLQKPHPELFATALGKLDLRAEDVWFLGDSLTADIGGANEAGMQTVWYNPYEEPREEHIDPTAQVSDWRQAQLLLEKFAMAM